MRFCPECENLLYPTTKKNVKYLVCRFCGYETKVDSEKDDTADYKIEEKIHHGNDVEIMEEEEPLPKIAVECPKCGNDFAFHWEKYNDDGELVLLYRCTRCKHVWKEAS
ncbi:MAG: transcription factor S [Candidatus Helarchaeota archaeon]